MLPITSVKSQPSYYKAWEVAVPYYNQLLVDTNGFSYVGGMAGSVFKIMKYDPSGNFVWQSNPISAASVKMKFDRNKDIIVAGVATITPTDKDFLVAKVTSAGLVSWITTVDNQNSIDSLIDFSVDFNNCVLAIGNTYINAGTNASFFTVKIDVTGGLLWKRTYAFNIAKVNSPISVIVDSANNAYVYGAIFSFTTGIDNDSLAFVKYRSDGSLIRAVRYFASCFNHRYNGYDRFFDGMKSFLFRNNIYFNHEMSCFEENTRSVIELVDTSFSNWSNFLDIPAVNIRGVRVYEDKGQLTITGDSTYINKIIGNTYNDPFFMVYGQNGLKSLYSIPLINKYGITFRANLLNNGNYSLSYSGGEAGSFIKFTITAVDSAVKNIFWYDVNDGFIYAQETDGYNSIFVLKNSMTGSVSLEKYKSSALGIESYCCNSDRLRISPNPAVDNIIIESLSSENQALQIFDLTGRLVLKQNAAGKISAINLNGLGSGIYTVCVTTKEGELHTRLAIMK